MKYEAKQYLFSAFTLLLSAFFFQKSFAMPRTASLLPKLIASLVFIFSAVMSLQAYRNSHRRQTEGGEAETSEGKIVAGRVAWYVCLMALYIFLISRVGYFIVTPLFMTISYMLLKAAGFVKAAAISVGFAIFIYALFVVFLKLPIPLGLMESFL